MRVVFLDIDGVVNTPMWSEKDGKLRCSYNHPEDACVNNFQACRWLGEFCLKHDYSVVVSSTWRKEGLARCIKCLRSGGLDERVNIVGVTPVLDGASRGDEISAWLNKHPEVSNFLILDDDTDMGNHIDRLIQCRSDVGFIQDEFYKAQMLHAAFEEMNI